MMFIVAKNIHNYCIEHKINTYCDEDTELIERLITESCPQIHSAL